MSDPNEFLHQLKQSTLDLFWKLSEKESNVRINSCMCLLQLLLKRQRNVENQSILCKDLQYSIERLVKGLASPRAAARVGYAVLLTKILKYIDVVQIDEILQFIKKHLSVSSKQDKRDIVFGQLFAFTALVRSGKLVEHSCLQDVFLSLYDLLQGKTYILIAGYEVILNLFSQLSKEKFKENVWPYLKKKISCGWETCSSDVLWLLLLCLRTYPDVVNTKYLKKQWQSEDIFCSDNWNHHKRIIKQTTACLPKLHPLCLEFLMHIKERKDMAIIWNVIIDKNLFELDHSEKAFVGFEMIKTVLQSTQKKKVIKCVLSSQFQTTFARNLLKPRHAMNPAANRLAEFFSDYVKQCTIAEVQIIVLKVFIQLPSIALLNQILKKKEVSSIIQNLLPDAVKFFCEILKSVIIKKKQHVSDDGASNYSLVVNQIGNLVSHPAIITDIEWRMNVIKFLFLHSFFNVNVATTDILHCDMITQDLPGSFRESCVNSFYKSLDSLSIKTDNQNPLQNFLHLLSLCEYADQLMCATENVLPVFPMEKVQNSWNRMKSIVHKLNKQSKKDGKENESNAFQVLFLQLGFLLFHDTQHIPEVLEELHICCKKALKIRKHLEENIATNAEEPSWVAVVIDILLSLLSRSSQHIRNFVVSVFSLLCPFITKEALHQILDVINPRKAEEESLLVHESDEEIHGDVEFESGSSSEESDNNGEESIADEEFRKSIKEALGPAAEDSDAESVTLSDSEMFKLDDAISKAFQSRINAKSSQLSEDKTMLHFRSRCFDLVISYLKSDPPMQLVLECVEPVLAAYEYGHHGKQQRHLLSKAISTLQVIVKIKKFHHQENIDMSQLKRLLKLLVAKCHKESDITVAKTLYSLCVFMVRCFRKLENSSSPSKKGETEVPSYIKIYLSALEAFVKGRCHIFPQFFISLMESYPDLAWFFVEPCQKYAFDNNVRIYKKTQFLGLILEALNFCKSQKCVTAKQWITFGKSFIPSAVEALKIVLSSTDVKPVYLTELLNVIYSCHSLVKEKSDESVLEQHAELLPYLMQLQKSKLKKLTKKGISAWKRIVVCVGGGIDEKKCSQMQCDEKEPSANAAENSENEVSNPKKRKKISESGQKSEKLCTKNSEADETYRITAESSASLEKSQVISTEQKKRKSKFKHSKRKKLKTTINDSQILNEGN